MKLDNDAIVKAVQDSLPGLVSDAVAKAMGKEGTEPEPRDAPPFEQRGSIIRGRKFKLEDKDKGIAAARFVRALAFGRGDPQRAKFFAQKSWDDEMGDEIQKALITSSMTAAGSMIPPEYAAEIIELLRSRAIIRAAGPRIMPMNSGSLTIRRQNAASSAAYVGESQDIGITNPDVGLIELTSKKLAAIVPVSNDLLAFSSGPSADEFVRDDLVLSMALREDRAFLRDDGTQHTPRGIRYWAAAANVTATNGTSATNIEADFKELLDSLESADVKLIRPVWFMHPTRKNHLRNLRDANGNLIYPEMRGNNPNIYGYPVFTTTSIPANLGGGSNESEIYFVDMVDAIIGEASGLEIVVDSSASYVEGGQLQSAFSRDETLIRAIARHDFAMRHRESAAVKTGVTWGG